MCPDCRDALRTDGSGICGGCLIGEYRHGGASDIRDSGSSLGRAFFGTDRCPDSGTDSSTHSRSGGNTCGYADGRFDTGICQFRFGKHILFNFRGGFQGSGGKARGLW